MSSKRTPSKCWIPLLNVHDPFRPPDPFSSSQSAGDLIGKHAMGRRLRTRDAVQLAVALHFHAAFPIGHFVCADQRLGDIATSEGLAVINPGE